ncbi:MAG: hypothetical protein ACRERV_08090 [Methylococcales bacterium]
MLPSKTALATLAVFGEQVYYRIVIRSIRRLCLHRNARDILFTISRLALGLAKRAERKEAIAAEKICVHSLDAPRRKARGLLMTKWGI